MSRRIVPVLALAFFAAPAAVAETYAVDPVHSSMTFRISHLGLAEVAGRFNEYGGDVVIDDDAAKCSFSMNVKVESIDTANVKRDEHLKADDYFDVKKYPTIAFKSTAVKAAKNGYEVTGDFTMHGVTKSISFVLAGGKTFEMKGVKRIGFSTSMTLKRSEYGVNGGIPAIGDDVHIAISFEGVKK
jgi:polyisoprenoid-binding protein YceI